MSIHYAPGPAFALVRPGLVVMVDESVGAEVVAALWAAIEAGDTGRDLATLLDTVTGVLDPTWRALPSFVIALVDGGDRGRGGDGARETYSAQVAVRGTFSATVTTPEAAELVSGPQVTTWVDKHVDDVTRLELVTSTAPEAGAPLLSIADGVVQVDRLLWTVQAAVERVVQVEEIEEIVVGVDDLDELHIDEPGPGAEDAHDGAADGPVEAPVEDAAVAPAVDDLPAAEQIESEFSRTLAGVPEEWEVEMAGTTTDEPTPAVIPAPVPAVNPVAVNPVPVISAAAVAPLAASSLGAAPVAPVLVLTVDDVEADVAEADDDRYDDDNDHTVVHGVTGPTDHRAAGDEVEPDAAAAEEEAAAEDDFDDFDDSTLFAAAVARVKSSMPPPPPPPPPAPTTSGFGALPPVPPPPVDVAPAAPQPAAPQPAAPEPAQPVAEQFRDPRGTEILARSCFFGHPNPPVRMTCAQCGGGLSPNAQLVERPSLGWVDVSTGERIELSVPIVVGRFPQAQTTGSPVSQRLVSVPSPSQDISRSHLEIRLEGWHVLLVDLETVNGTTLLRAGQAPRRLHPLEPTLVAEGDVVDLGDGVQLAFHGLA